MLKTSKGNLKFRTKKGEYYKYLFINVANKFRTDNDKFRTADDKIKTDTTKSLGLPITNLGLT